MSDDQLITPFCDEELQAIAKMQAILDPLTDRRMRCRILVWLVDKNGFTGIQGTVDK